MPLSGPAHPADRLSLQGRWSRVFRWRRARRSAVGESCAAARVRHAAREAATPAPPDGASAEPHPGPGRGRKVIEPWTTPGELTATTVVVEGARRRAQAREVHCLGRTAAAQWQDPDVNGRVRCRRQAVRCQRARLQCRPVASWPPVGQVDGGSRDRHGHAQAGARRPEPTSATRTNRVGRRGSRGLSRRRRGCERAPRQLSAAPRRRRDVWTQA